MRPQSGLNWILSPPLRVPSAAPFSPPESLLLSSFCVSHAPLRACLFLSLCFSFLHPPPSSPLSPPDFQLAPLTGACSVWDVGPGCPHPMQSSTLTDRLYKSEGLASFTILESEGSEKPSRLVLYCTREARGAWRGSGPSQSHQPALVMASGCTVARTLPPGGCEPVARWMPRLHPLQVIVWRTRCAGIEHLRSTTFCVQESHCQKTHLKTKNKNPCRGRKGGRNEKISLGSN